MPPSSLPMVLLPGWQRRGNIIAELQGVPSSEACAEHCREALPGCSFFTFCQAQVGTGESQCRRRCRRRQQAAHRRSETLPPLLPCAVLPAALAGRLQRRVPD